MFKVSDMNKKFTYFIIILLSCCSAYYSVVGLVALFPAIALDIIITASVLEISKLWGLHYLSKYWDAVEFTKLRLAKFIYGFLIVTQMMLTMIGVFGHLSAGHLEQVAPLGNISAQVKDLEQQEKYLVEQRDNLQSRLLQIQQISANAMSKDNINVSKDKRLNSTMTDISRQISTTNEQLTDIRNKLLELNKSNIEVEAKLGPIKYAAEALGFDKDSAVKFIIALIMCGMEPMVAIMVIINTKLSQKKNDDDDPPPKIKNTASEIHTDTIVDSSVVDSSSSIDKIQNVTYPPTYISNIVKKCDYADGMVNIDAEPYEELYESIVMFVTGVDISKKKRGRPRKKPVDKTSNIENVLAGSRQVAHVTTPNNGRIAYLPELSDTRAIKKIALSENLPQDDIVLSGLKLD